MSNRFLPFITEKSGPEAIFRILIKLPVSDSQLITIYPAILKLGVEHIRRYLNELPSNLSNEELIVKLVDKYRSLSIPMEAVDYWKYVVRIQGMDVTVKNNSKYTADNLAIMVASVAEIKPEELKALGVDGREGKLVDFSKPDFDCSVDCLKSILFSSNSNNMVGFTTKQEFKAYLALKVSSVKSTTPVFQFTPVKIKHYEGIPNNPEERLENGPY